MGCTAAARGSPGTTTRADFQQKWILISPYPRPSHSPSDLRAVLLGLQCPVPMIPTDVAPWRPVAEVREMERVETVAGGIAAFQSVFGTFPGRWRVEGSSWPD